MEKPRESTGYFDLDLYLERMEASHVQRVIEGVRMLEERAGKRRIPENLRETQEELRKNMHEWSGL